MSLQSNEPNKWTVDTHCHQLLSTGRTYFDILLYNCYDTDDHTMDIAKLSVAFDDLISVYEKLFDFSLGLSGYQFIGLFLQNGFSNIDFVSLQVAYFILSIGFLISLFGVLFCFIIIEYLRGCRDEDPSFIIVGIKRYTPIFKFTDKIIYVNCICFLVPINIIIYESLDFPFAVSYNVLSFLLFMVGIFTHKTIIIDKQKYRIGISSSKKEYKRKIYHIE